MKKKLLGMLITLMATSFALSLSGCFGSSNGDGGNSNNEPSITYTTISTVAELQAISNQKGNYKLSNNIDISGSSWTPIEGFTGLLEGDNYEISGLTISGNKANIGLFSTLKGTVQNLKMTAVDINGTGDAGTAGSVCGTNEGTIKNVFASGKINAPYYENVGGIAGFSNQNILKCTNGATVSAFSNVGGVVGRCEPKSGSTCTISENINNGIVSGNDNIGGVIGSLGIYSARYSSDKTTVTVTDLKNTQAVSGTGDYIGGIIGKQTTGSNNSYSSCSISSCTNSGVVNGKDYTGGIIGGAACLSEISSCTNSANITGSNYVGGYVGQSAGATVKLATNSNVITGKGYVGGIAGYAGKMVHCTNNGEVKSTAIIVEDSTSYVYLGGVAGFATGAESCTNSVDITSNLNGLNVGGIIGRCEPASGSTSTISDNNNDGKITGYEHVGGIFGSLGIYSARYSSDKSTITINNCENTKAISGTGNYVGGIIGRQTTGSNNSYSTCSISSCTNSGTINGKDYVAGIIGKAACLSEMTSCSNVADITGGNYVGGYAGQAENATIRIATNNNTIIGKAYVGGIVGYAGLVEHCTNNGEVKSTAIIVEDSTSYVYLGGIVGFATGATSCVNNADITVSLNGLNVGGIVGRCEPKQGSTSTISGNINNGVITAYENVGGIIGSLGIYSARYSSDKSTITISDCENTKAVNGTSNYVGGIIGKQTTGSNNSYSTCTISNCSNSGNIAGNNYVAGIIAYGECTKSDSNIWSSNTNTGTVSGSNKGQLYGYLK